tara:strand:- start:449 stop:676 length:228 start_codon:yes stop_codon:yes gene_type:complete
MLRNDKQPERGIIIEEIDSFGGGCRLLVLGDCEYVEYSSKVKGVTMLNLDTGEIERQRRDFDWYNWYHHPTGWDY